MKKRHLILIIGVLLVTLFVVRQKRERNIYQTHLSQSERLVVTAPAPLAACDYSCTVNVIGSDETETFHQVVKAPLTEAKVFHISNYELRIESAKDSDEILIQFITTKDENQSITMGIAGCDFTGEDITRFDIPEDNKHVEITCKH